MPFDRQRHTGRLPRLVPENYRGKSYVHWSMTIEIRATGWLDELHHARLREYLTHALGRYRLVCPAYCVMPDHAHFLWLGWSRQSDQRKAAKLFREAWNRELAKAGCGLQLQAHDHVLREWDRKRSAFETVAAYIRENPVRSGLAATANEYAFSGAVVPGYPMLAPSEEDYWEKFWRIFDRLVEQDEAER